MKKKVVVLSLVVTAIFVGALALTASAAEQDKAKNGKIAVSEGVKSKEVTMTGKLSCTFCKLAHPDKTCKPECCTDCIKAGDPPMLTDADGNMYLLLTSEQKIPLMNAERWAMVGQDVTIKGLLVKGKGIHAIYVDSMEKAAAMVPESKEKKKQ